MLFYGIAATETTKAIGVKARLSRTESRSQLLLTMVDGGHTSSLRLSSDTASRSIIALSRKRLTGGLPPLAIYTQTKYLHLPSAENEIGDRHKHMFFFIKVMYVLLKMN